MADKKNTKTTPSQKKSNPSIKSNDNESNATATKGFPIVGIGGSAGSFKAIEKFFMQMPPDSGMAFIIVMHLDPNHHVNVSELIQKFTHMPVKQAEDELVVVPNHVYIIPPNADMGMHSGKLLLFEANRGQRQHMPIDYFLQSLAEDQWNHAVAIIFSGMGTDGEIGLRMIKEKLGMAMVQDPDTAEYASMPKSAISSGLVDYVLPPQEMPLKLIQYLKHPLLSEETVTKTISESKNNHNIQKILMLLRTHTGHDFSLYKKNTVVRRIDRRIACHQLPDYTHYISFIRENPHEIDDLFNELLIGVTKFFRDAQAYEILKINLDNILKTKAPDEPIRVWIAGCSTGEEAYSVAILIQEFLLTQQLKRPAQVQIFATDLDAQAIEHARQGVYFDNIVSEVSPQRLERFFVKGDNTYTVKKELREMIIFAQHNLIKDAPFTRLDLLCCRNVMIYLTTDLQKKILPLFHYSLNMKGLLFMGPAETVGAFGSMFKVLDGKWKLFERQEDASANNKMIDFPFNVSTQPGRILRHDTMNKTIKTNDLSETFNKVLLENYSPAAILINDKGDILYLNGKTGKYLELSSGAAAMNIHRMAREEIKYPLGNAVHQVFLYKNQVQLSEIKLKEGTQVHLLNIHVSYLEGSSLQGLALVVFEDMGVLKKPKQKSSKYYLPASEGHIEELQKELIYTKQQLHTTIEQMETSLEELKSTNEELQSTNEELQSTNEESLTTKEEMQSLNEELMTINMQYQVKGEELTQLNNDMKNLLDSTETGTIFLDTQLNILRYTPQVKKLFNVIPTDIGRSITHIVSNFDYPAVEQDITDVIDKLTGKEVEVKTRSKDWYNLRIMPYRTLDNFISGAVLTFNKITPLKAMEDRLGMLQKYIATTLQHIKTPVILVDKDMWVVGANPAFLDFFNLRDHEVTEQLITELFHNKWQTNQLDELLQKCINKEMTVTLYHNFPTIGLKHLQVSSIPYKENASSIAYMMQINFNEKAEQ